ncbi:MAG: DNA polymerase III subunit alpha, partial [Myxococcota bacterium]|nr:DNA polymerase III subunit alpha [Myxococcota bacterium]
FGAVEFYKAARSANIKPILGSEVNLVPEDRRDPDVRRSGTIVLLCRDETGYRNLCYLLSRAYMDTPPRVMTPRIDRGLLAERAQGLVALSGSLSGEIPQLLLKGDDRGAAELARHYSGLFPGAFFLEMVRSGIREQDKVNAGLLAISEEMGIPIVGTTDAHYLDKEDASAHEILMCIQMGKLQPDLDSPARITDDLYLASTAEVTDRFSDLPEALENTQRIADMCDVTLDLGKNYLPNYPVPEGDTPASYLARVSEEGLQERLDFARKSGLEPDEQVYRDRLKVELDIIDQMDFPGYFLIVWDFIRHARETNVPVGPGRGSGAGSLVAYCLWITDIDPIPYGLLFERFLNPERVSMPDFDIDFCMNKRDQVIRYVTQQYGEDCVGQIITYGSMKAKAVVRDVGRVMGLSYGEGDRAAKLIPDALDITLEIAF